MTQIERDPQKLTLRSGSTTVTLDKTAVKVTMRRKTLFWARKPIERPLSDIAEATVDSNVDRASGVEICNTMLVMAQGEAWAIPAASKQDAQGTAAAVRDFLGVAGTDTKGA